MSKFEKVNIDIEANNLLAPMLDYSSMPFKLKDDSKLWCVVLRDEDTEEAVLFLPEQYLSYVAPNTKEGIEYNNYKKVALTKENLKEYLKDTKIISGHNIVNYDLPVLSLFGMLDYTVGYPEFDSSPAVSSTLFNKPVIISDTLIMSKLFNPDLLDKHGKHSLAAWGLRLGFPKIDFHEFHEWSWFMCYYCINDTLVATKIHKQLSKDLKDSDWNLAYAQELKLVDLTVKQEHFGFKFDSNLAKWCVNDLQTKLEEGAKNIEPLLPEKQLTKTNLAKVTPPVKQLKANGEPNSFITKFAERFGATITTKPRLEDSDAVDYYFNFQDKEYKIPFTEPLFSTEPTSLKNHAEVKAYLISLGWQPSEWKERDLTKDEKKHNKTPDKVEEAIIRYVNATQTNPFKKERYAFLGLKEENDMEKHLLSLYRSNQKTGLKVITSPSLRIGASKELCPNLLALSEKIPFAKELTDWYVYSHRLSSISGGEVDEDGEPEKGFLSAVREDGRVPTPADTLGAATFRYKHSVICNIPRASSLYGDKMRALFGAGDNYYQLGFDFASLEARIQAHYCYPFTQGPELAVSLLAEKPNDIHCVTEDTEILTINGWKKYNEISLSTRVAQYEAGKITFVNPTNIFLKDVKDETLYQFNNMLLTSEHRVLSAHHESKYTVHSAKDIFNMSAQRQYPVAANYEGPQVPVKAFKHYILLAIYYLFGTKEEDVISILLYDYEQGKQNLAKNILNYCEIDYSEITSDGTIDIQIDRDDSSYYLFKYIEQEVFEKQLMNLFTVYFSSHSSRVEYIKTLLYLMDSEYSETRNRSMTTWEDLEFLEFIQSLAALSNLKTNITPSTKVPSVYVLVIYWNSNNKTINKNSKSLVENYTGKIWCVSVPSSFVVFRRNSEVFISGNSINAKKLGLSRDNAKSVSYACLPEDSTEVLTTTGWKTINELNELDPILSYNPDKDIIEEDSIFKIHRYKDAEIIKVSNSKVSFECTADHRWYGKKDKNSTLDFFLANEINKDIQLLTDINLFETGFKQEPSRTTDVFCLTTNNSTFIIRQNKKFTSITGNCLYGASPEKFKKMLSMTIDQATNLYNDYWNAVPALSEFKDKLSTYWNQVNKDHIIGIDKRKLRARSAHSLVNMMFQSAGALASKYTAVRVAQLLEQQNLLGDPFKHSEEDVKIFQMIVYHK